MRLNRFYTERQNLRIGSSVKLADSDISHIRKVLRLSKGDKIILFNGSEEYVGELNLVTKEFVTAILVKILSEKKESKNDLKITLFQGLLKAGKLDLIVEKTTEIGIDYIVPTECEFSQSNLESAKTKVERWNKVAMAASKQSERVALLEVLTPIKFQEIFKLKEEFDLILFFTIPRDIILESLKSEVLNLEIFKDKKKVALVIGPEGGFSPREHKAASENGLNFVKLGDTILRSETAAIAAASIVKFLVG